MVEILREIPWSELEQMVRKVPLKMERPDKSKIFVYDKATIELRTVMPEELAASSFYLVQKSADFQRALHDELKKVGYDTLHLKGGLEIRNSQGEIWRLIPPVVEVMHEDVQHVNSRGDIDYSGKQAKVAVHIVNDGMHRVALARDLGSSVNVIHVSGIPEEFPYYALPNGWDQVRTFTDVPKTKAEKKFYRRNDCYALYRDFDVLGCGKPRNTGSGEVVK
jgi:hypothetical protein